MTHSDCSPAVLLFGFGSDPRAVKIRIYLRQQRILALDAEPEDYGLSLGELLAIPFFPKTERDDSEADISGEMLVMYAMQGKLMQAFLQFLREEGLAPGALKAIATPTNLFWSGKKLFAELKREHEWFERQQAKAAKAAGNGG